MPAGRRKRSRPTKTGARSSAVSPPGTTAKAVATVDGERLESQEFPWPGDGGIRLMLVATPKGGDAPPPVFQPQPGNVVFGDQTRVIIDHADDALQVYYLLDIVNSARAPVNPPSADRHRHAVWRAQRHRAERCAAGGRARRSRVHHGPVRLGPNRECRLPFECRSRAAT